MPQRFLTDDELHDARGLLGWQFWFAPILFSLACVGTGWVAATGEAIGLWLFVLFCTVTVFLWVWRLRQFKKFQADLDHRIVEVLEGAPQKSWIARNGDCYVVISGQTIKVPNDSYGALQDATIVKLTFLPTSRIAVTVETGRGIGLS